MILLAFRNIFRNKRRSLLLTLALAVSVSMVTCTRFITYGMHEETIWHAVGLKSGYIQVMANGYLENPSILRAMDVTPGLMDSLKTEGVTVLSPRIEASALASYKENTLFLTVTGVNPEKEKQVTTIDQNLVKGRFFKNHETHVNPRGRTVYRAVLGQTAARNLEAEIGDVISLVTTEFDGSIGAVLAQVTGFFRTGDPMLDQRGLYISLPAARTLFGTEAGTDEKVDRYTSIVVGAPDVKTAGEIYEKLRTRYPPPKLPEGTNRGTSDNYQPVVHQWDELIPGVMQLIELDQISAEISLFFVIFIMAFGVLNVVQMALHERRREFSVLVAIGTERLRLYTTYILEILFLLFPGMALGTLLGMGMGAYFEYYPIVLSGEEAEAFSASGFVPKIKAIVAADELIIGILTIIIPILILCMVAARRIYKLKPVQEINEK